MMRDEKATIEIYQSLPALERHPSHIGALLRLRGLSTKLQTESFRVLDLGCGKGSEILSFSEQFPSAKFIGLDQCKSSIVSASGVASDLGLKNVEFYCCDLFSYKSSEPFDYIICHGVYSWIDRDKRTDLLSKISELLDSKGVCFLSLNTLPGILEREKLSRMLQSEVRSSQGVLSQTKKCRDLLEQIAGSKTEQQSEADPLAQEAKELLRRSDPFLLAELLNPECSGEYLKDFSQRVEKVGLQRLADASPERSIIEWGTREGWDQPDSLNIFKQALDDECACDLALPRPYRGVLLVRDEVAQQKMLFAEQRLNFLFLTSSLVCLEGQPDIFSQSSLRFMTPNGIEIDVADPLTKGALIYLRTHWPRPVQLEELVESAAQLTGIGPETDKADFFSTIHQQFLRGHVRLFTSTMKISRSLSPKPAVSAFCRSQASQQDWITTLSHEWFPIDQLDRFLLVLLNGEHALEQIEQKLLEAFSAGLFSAKEDGKNVSSSAELSRIVHSELSERLSRYREQSILKESD